MLNRLQTLLNLSFIIPNSQPKVYKIKQNGVEEKIDRKTLNLPDRQRYIIYLYRFLLKREPSDKEVENYLRTPLNELELFQSFVFSQEFADKNHWATSERKEYINCLYQVLLKREPSTEEQSNYANNQESYLSLLKSFVSSQEYSSVLARTSLDLTTYLGSSSHMIGASEPIYPSVLLRWYYDVAAYLLQLGQSPNSIGKPVTQFSPQWIKDQETRPILTILTSLYRGRNYIHSFLENITHQTIFPQCKLFIVDADSPENEYEIIRYYLDKFPDNIVYYRFDKTISIYAAWNFAIKNSHSRFITNANLDDCHRYDALELKVKALLENHEIDIVYSDVYYSFIANLPFEAIEYAGLHTHLPIADQQNLLQFNSPHNAPLWRRSLHDKIGLFDEDYQSAGDLDFWLRAARSGCQFTKISEIVTAYYHNPQGLSTRWHGTAYQELRQIQQAYQD